MDKKKHCPFLPSAHPFFSPSPSPSSPPLFSASNPRWIGCCRVYFTWGLLLVQSLFLWLLLTYIQQYTLKGLLMYKGWMFDPRGSVESYSHLVSPGNEANGHCKQFICLELSDQHRVQCRTGLSFYSICFSFISSLHHLISLSLFFSSLNLSLLLPLPSFPSFFHNSKQSLTTKIWALLVKFVAGPFQPLLLSYQRSLPRLPVPRLEDTCRRVRMIVCYIYKLLLAWQQLLVTNRTEFLRKQDNE